MEGTAHGGMNEVFVDLSVTQKWVRTRAVAEHHGAKRGAFQIKQPALCDAGGHKECGAGAEDNLRLTAEAQTGVVRLPDGSYLNIVGIEATVGARR